jgi:hypothetical protein
MMMSATNKRTENEYTYTSQWAVDLDDVRSAVSGMQDHELLVKRKGRVATGLVPI